MQPQQPYINNAPQATPPTPGQYDFIVNYGAKPPGGLFGIGTSTKSRVVVAGAGAVILLLFAWLFVALLSGSSSANVAELTTLAQQQAELVRISKQPITASQTEATRNFAASTRLSLMSEEQVFITYLAKAGTNLSAKTLQARQNTQTDTQLRNALVSGAYDQTYTTIAQSQLKAYSQALQQTYANTKNKSERQLLSDAYRDAALLLQQSNQQ